MYVFLFWTHKVWLKQQTHDSQFHFLSITRNVKLFPICFMQTICPGFKSVTLTFIQKTQKGMIF